MQIIQLEKGLYGLKQGLKKWQIRFKNLFFTKGFKPLIFNSVVFYNVKSEYFMSIFINDYLLISFKLKYI